ncbi:MAG: T9SS type A sorting domain-containing protein, partial [Candidatus Cloacimonetes bacterium]|nr:T9SS type A sorting domain-containing protein [Candidatus Cloacimonadota bacterium]
YLSLSSISPNPFHNTAVINIKSQEVRKAEISIYNLKGQKIRTWNQTLLSGSTELVWNATNTSGTKVPPGIYLINIKSGGETITAKVLLN